MGHFRETSTVDELDSVNRRLNLLMYVSVALLVVVISITVMVVPTTVYTRAGARESLELYKLSKCREELVYTFNQSLVTNTLLRSSLQSTLLEIVFENAEDMGLEEFQSELTVLREQLLLSTLDLSKAFEIYQDGLSLSIENRDEFLRSCEG